MSKKKRPAFTIAAPSAENEPFPCLVCEETGLTGGSPCTACDGSGYVNADGTPYTPSRQDPIGEAP